MYWGLVHRVHGTLSTHACGAVLAQTRNTTYREWGWRLFEGIERSARLAHDAGYAAVDDVAQVPPVHLDRMDSFFLSETLKYLYLLFAPPSTLPLEEWVLNTEAHPFPILESRRY